MQNLSLRTGLISGINLEETMQTLVPSYFGVDGAVERISFNADNAHNTMIKAFEELKIKNLSVDILCTEKYEKVAKDIVNSWQSSIGVVL